jgi:Flp pilus assembly protein protease CpaA
VFLGVAGLIMGVTSIVKIGVAVVIAAAVTAFVAVLIRDRSS